MPRPDRFRAKEREIAGVAEPGAEDTKTGAVAAPLLRKNAAEIRRRVLRVRPDTENELAPEAVDSEPSNVSETKTGPVSEADPELEVSRRVARRMGWVPKEEWKRDPDKWTDAPEFLETTPHRFETLQERQRRWGQIAEAEAERRAAEAVAAAKAEHAAAVKTGDVEAANAAVQKMANPGPPPQTRAWLGKNPWFHTDPDAQTMAVRAIESAANSGADIDMQLQAGEAAVRRRFPEYFDDAPVTRTEPRREQAETKLSDLRPPSLASGSRSGSATRTQPKEKGWMDIPSADRNQMQPFIKKFIRRGMTQGEAQDAYARTYWKEQAS